MPRRASLAFRSQDVRRKVWMLEAKRKGLRPERARELSSILSKLQKKVKYMNRQQHRGEFKDSLRRIFKVEDEHSLTQWSKYITDHQQTARAAGLKWATECYMKNDWAGQPTPSSQVLNEILLHLVKVPGYDYSTWSRNRLCHEAQYLLSVYDKIPPSTSSDEFKKAKVRMIADMMFQEVLQSELAKGLAVSSEELAEAQQALAPTNDPRWNLLPLEMTPLFYKEKHLQWLGVQNWTVSEVNGLPLRGFTAISDRPVLSKATSSLGTLRGNNKEETTSLVHGRALCHEDDMMQDVAMGSQHLGENDGWEDCEHIKEAKETPNDYHKFGNPFPSPDDFPWD
ncbi:MAG: hypothetical protein Q9168_004093 [Polycauliona sp. 1 TL-2023]